MLSAAVRCGFGSELELEQDSRAFRALTGAVSTLSRLEHSDGTAWLGAQDVLSALAGLLIPRSRVQDTDAVQVLSVQRARARRFAVVAVLGLTEGEFPGHSDPPSLLTGAQRARLDSLGGGGLFVPETNQEPALFLSALSRAWQLLLLSARDADDGGGEVMPSRFWCSARELLAVNERDHQTRTLAEVVFSVDAAPSRRHYLRACTADGRSPHPDVWSDYGPERVRPWRRPAASLTAPSILGELAATESFSPSSLETYLACPFAWFVERVVGVEELEPELDSRSTGQLLHGVLAETYRELASRGVLPLRLESVAEAERLAYAAIERLLADDGCPGTPAEKRLAIWRLRRMVRRVFQLESASRSALATAETEATVGGRAGVDIGGIKIRGRIDRIDADPGATNLFVLDYKSGSIPDLSSLGTERALQLPLYLMALAAERPAAQVIGGAYLSPREGRRSGVVRAGSEGLLGEGGQGFRVMDSVDTQSLFDRTRALALDAAAGMRAGSIAPREGDCPSWCELGPACRARAGGHRP
jgi:ATP-dependent helicase/nuclease subunit B